ncbi:MAG: FtsQ-type POTRA domain-containing protein [Oscillospiraceae bacterium]|jgi:cell division septal protein FtsQ|nr:FtsQ-type POTRA domain-containing protein [Oscillospiraceae bacterium]
MKTKGNIDVPEYVRRKRKAAIAKQRRRRRRVFVKMFSLLILFFIVLCGLYFSLGIFFKVEKIFVAGESVYTPQDIVNASGVKKDANIFGLNLHKIKTEVEKRLLYIDNVTVKMRWPTSLVMTATKAVPTFALECNNKYIILSEGFKVLEKNALTIGEKLDIIRGVKLNSPMLGGSIKNSKLINLTELRDCLRGVGLGNVKIYDFTNPQEVQLTLCKGERCRIEIKFGNFDQMVYKVKFLLAVLNDRMDGNVSGEIDLTDLLVSKKAIWKPSIDSDSDKKDVETNENNGEGVVN